MSAYAIGLGVRMSALADFRNAMQQRGLVPPSEILTDGKLHRCDVRGKNGSGDGAYILHDDDRPAGGFQNWQDGLIGRAGRTSMVGVP